MGSSVNDRVRTENEVVPSKKPKVLYQAILGPVPVELPLDLSSRVPIEVLLKSLGLDPLQCCDDVPKTFVFPCSETNENLDFLESRVTKIIKSNNNSDTIHTSSMIITNHLGREKMNFRSDCR